MRDYESYNVFGEEVQAERLEDNNIDNNTDENIDNHTNQNIDNNIDDKGEDQQETGEAEGNGLSVINVTDYKEESLPVATYGVRLEKEAQEQSFTKEPSLEEEKPEFEKTQKAETRDTSFNTYVSQKKEKSALEKWGVRLIKLIIFCMLLPFIGVIGTIVLGVAGAVSFGILGCIGGGLIVLMSTIFFAGQISLSFVLLGVAIAITGISFGLIMALIVIMMIKFIIDLIGNKRKINQKAKKGVH